MSASGKLKKDRAAQRDQNEHKPEGTTSVMSKDNENAGH